MCSVFELITTNQNKTRMDWAVFDFCYVRTAYTHICSFRSSSPVCTGNEDRWFPVETKVKILIIRVKIGQSFIGEFDHTFVVHLLRTVYVHWIYNDNE